MFQNISTSRRHRGPSRFVGNVQNLCNSLLARAGRKTNTFFRPFFQTRSRAFHFRNTNCPRETTARRSRKTMPRTRFNSSTINTIDDSRCDGMFNPPSNRSRIFPPPGAFVAFNINTATNRQIIRGSREGTPSTNC